MSEAPEGAVRSWIETFRAQTRWDLLRLWRTQSSGAESVLAVEDPWGERHRPDWHQRGLLSWPRGGRWLHLTLQLSCPERWRQQQAGDRAARLALRWWADAAELWVDGELVHQGDLFDSGCRWRLPQSWWAGRLLSLELRLRSPLHDDGALITSALEQEPLERNDPSGVLSATGLELLELRGGEAAIQPLLADLDPGELSVQAAMADRLQAPAQRHPTGGFHVLGHAHLDLAWLWPVADTWQAAERTFASALELMERYPELHFAHSTPALYAWLEQHRPALFERIAQASASGRWEPINGPWVESDCVLVSTASLLKQFEWGQAYSRSRFPRWRHDLCWLPDSFGFAAGLPAVAAATGVRWFCTHKLAWNATTPFPHRLFRWRAPGGSELLALSTAPIGTDGDPLAMERYRLQWQAVSGIETALWLPGVGDHGGGPTAEMLEQLALWRDHPQACPQQHGSLRSYLQALEPLAAQLPVWRDELYLELHRGCATTRPDQKRHNRSLERLLREADLAAALLVLSGSRGAESSDWSSLLFQQFHDILPGTSIPEVFEQAEPQWRQARRRARQQRDQMLHGWLGGWCPAEAAAEPWWLLQLQNRPAAQRTLRLPAGHWQLEGEPQRLPLQPAPGGGVWVQVPLGDGIGARRLLRQRLREVPPGAVGSEFGSELGSELGWEASIQHPVTLEARSGGWLLANGLIQVQLGSGGIEQIWGPDDRPQLAAPVQWRRWRDQGEFWDAWDLAADYRSHPLPLDWHPSAELVESGPLLVRVVWRGRCGVSALRLDVQLRANSPYLECHLQVDWRQRHELLRLEIPLAQAAVRYAADTAGGVLERPAQPSNAREEARWEVPVISWVATQAAPAQGGLALLLDGPQGVSVQPELLGASLLRAPTWPDPSADNGLQRLRLALLPCPEGWSAAEVPLWAQQFREPLWLRPALRHHEQRPQGFDLGNAKVQLLSCKPLDASLDDAAGEVCLTLQNLSPARQRIQCPEGWNWRVPGTSGWQAIDQVLRPWQILELRARAQSS
ncbi:MAG: alpha-mannosidase [Vulcanococcus sp.]